MRVIIINPQDCTISEGSVSSLADMQAIVGGLIQPVGLPCGHEVYVNEEGLFEESFMPFRILGAPTLVGPAFIAGGIDDNGDMLPATMTLLDAASRVRFAP